MRIIWREHAIVDLERLAERAPAQAEAVMAAIDWLAQTGHPNVGRTVGPRGLRYWPVPPQGIYYYSRATDLVIIRIRDARRRRSSW